MALTRSMLKGMNLTEEQVSAIIDAHKETVDALKEQRDGYKADAEKLGVVQKELDDYKNGKDWKAEYDKLNKSFQDYKAEVAGKETLAAKRAAFRKLLSDENIPDKFHDRILKMTDFEGVELDGDKIKDEAAQREAISKEWGDFKATTKIESDKPENPPKDNPLTFDKMSLTEKMRYANENPNAAEVRAWLGN